MKKHLKAIAFILVCAFGHTQSYAAVQLRADEIIAQGRAVRVQLEQQLNNQQVVAELQKMGIQKTEARMRLAAMTDRELQQVAQGVERQAGGEVIVVSVGVALLILLVIILLVRPGSSGGGTTVVH